MTCKNGIIHSSMKKHRLKFLLIEILLVAVLIAYFFSNYPYIINKFSDPVQLEISLFGETAPVKDVPKPFELHRNDDVTIPDYALKGGSYWQGKDYEFYLPVKDATPTGTVFTNEITNTGSEATIEDVSSVLYTMDIGGVRTLVLTYPETDLEKMDTITGIFTEIPLIVDYYLANSKTFDKDTPVCTYMLDTRGLEMESETFDVVFCIILSLIILFLFVKLIIQFANFKKTPTYAQLEKYGEIEEIEKEIEKELLEVTFSPKETVTENWILKEDTFRLKIIKNHRKHGRFVYVKK